MLGVSSDKVKICPYDENWKIAYKKEKTTLLELLKGMEFQIEHVGSTSIDGLSAKPIIDIAIGTNNKQTIYEIAKILEENNYETRDSLDTKGEIFASKGNEYYIHIQEIGSTYWNNFMYFKKYLLDHPESVKEYEKLKNDLAIVYKDDRKKYTASKNEFISKIIKQAKEIYKL